LHLAQDISEEKEVSENDLIFQNEDATDEFAFMPETPSRDPPIFGHHDMFADGKGKCRSGFRTAQDSNVMR